VDLAVNVLVTGSNGFIGSALCGSLTLRAHTVVPVVRRQSNLLKAVTIVGDDEAAWNSALSGCDSVIHLAGRAHVMRDLEADPLRAFRASNVAATLQLATRAVAVGVKRLVFLSSVKVNGESTQTGDAFRPNDCTFPCDPYAVSKWEAEQGLMEVARNTGLELVIIRPTLVYGPKVKGNFATLIKWVRRGVPLPLGAVNNQRSLIGLENLVDFITLCADRAATPQAANQVFLVSDGKPVSTTELLQKIAAAYGTRHLLVPVPSGLMRFCAAMVGKAAVADRLLGSLVVDDSKAREVLGWRPPLSMEEQLRRMAAIDG
jgi:nucleoside-diphosphate-sugar epimerase